MTTINITINAIDPDSFRSILEKNKDKIIDILTEGVDSNETKQEDEYPLPDGAIIIPCSLARMVFRGCRHGKH